MQLFLVENSVKTAYSPRYSPILQENSQNPLKFAPPKFV